MQSQTEQDSFESESEVEGFKTGDIIQGRFVLHEMIGEGSFGQVFKVVDHKSNDQIMAIKIEDYSGDTSMLEREIKVLIEMRKKTGFPQIKFYGQERGFIYCIMGLLGRNLESLLRKCGGFFTTATVLRIAVQILTRIEILHASRFIHRDIKPDNFVLGIGSQMNVVHLIDFGLSKYYQNSKGEHIQPAKKAGLIGTARYASINAHEEQEQSRRDDMESIGYILIYLATGSLPWMNLQIESKEQKYIKIHQLKKTTKIETMCNKLPKSFTKYLTDVKSLSFSQTPNYKQLKQYFQDDIDQLPSTTANKGNHLYDWEALPEYQQKKKHMTVHIMQPTSNEEKPQAEEDIKQSSPLKKNKVQLDTTQMDRQLQDLKEYQRCQSPKKQPQQQPSSPTKKNKKPIMINIIEVQPVQSQLIQNRHLNKNTTAYLVPPTIDSAQNILDSYPASLASSRKINYEGHSEDIESENNLRPIWQISSAVNNALPQGIKRPTIIRSEAKSHTQVQTLKNISQTFVAPKSMFAKGDDASIEDCD